MIKRIKNKIARILSDKAREVDYRTLKKKYRNKPVEPWAYIRVKNEIKTIEASLNSILPAIKKGVIGYCPSDDGSEEFIEIFCKQNTGFIPFKYNFDVIPPNDERYFEGGYQKEQQLDAYYNAVLDKIPNGEWLIKIDVDQIYDANKLKKMFYLPKYDDDCIVISRLECDYKDKHFYLYKNTPYSAGWDHWLLKKTEKIHFSFEKGTGSNPMYNKGRYAFEVLDISHLRKITTEVVTWHFPLLKNRRKNIIVETIPLSNFKTVLNPKKQKVDLDMFDENKLVKLMKFIKDEK